MSCKTKEGAVADQTDLNCRLVPDHGPTVPSVTTTAPTCSKRATQDQNKFKISARKGVPDIKS